MKKMTKSAKNISPEMALQFLENIRVLAEDKDEPTKLISLRVPENILRLLKAKAKIENKKYQSLSLGRAGDYLKNYYKKQFNADKLPLLLEQPFEVKLEKKGEKQLRIGGAMDRVDKLSSGKIEIIDYKTGGSVLTQKEVDKNDQLTFYALAASKMTGPPFGIKPENIVLSLYYFEDQIKISTQRTQAQLDQFEAELFKTRHEIEESGFACSGSYWCQDCEFGTFCNSSVDRL